MIDKDTFLALARTQPISHPQVENCWNHLVSEIEFDHVRPAEITEIIDALSRGMDIGFYDLLFELEAGRLKVSLANLADECAPEAMLAALRSLQERVQMADGRRDGGGEAASGGDVDLSRPALEAQVRLVLGSLLGVPPASIRPTTAPDNSLRPMIERARRISRRIASTDPDEQARAQAEAREVSQELETLLQQKLPLMQAIAERLQTVLQAEETTHPDAAVEALRTLHDWLHGVGQHTNERIDHLIATLERKVGPLLDPDQEIRQQQDRERLQATVRDSIATSLQARGFSTTDVNKPEKS